MLKKIFFIFYFLFFIFLLSGCQALPSTGKFIPTIPPSAFGGQVCLDPSTVGTEPVLKNIPKPEMSNTPFPNSGMCAGRSETCAGPDRADYVLAASSVKVEKIWPHAPTTRLVKQTLPPESQYDSVRERVFRASCNDWCGLGLPYGGTFHCDFIFLLKAEESTPPKDGALFDILLRKDATIPDKIKCQGQTQGAQIQAEDEGEGNTWVNLAGFRWVWVEQEDPTLLKIDMRTTDQGRRYLGNTFFRGKEYEGYLDLTVKIDPNEEILYLVPPGQVAAAEASPNPYFRFNYKEFRKTPEVKPTGKTLQLGTFKPAVSSGWWRKWVDESKPAIYLYPKEPTRLTVKLHPAGKLTVSDPAYDPENGWRVIAYPDGTLYNFDNNYKDYKIYNYLYYEANLDRVYIEPKGFIVEGKNLVRFFETTLSKLGLNDQETQDFIDYWTSRLDANQPYYFINFLDNEQIEALEPLTMKQWNNETIVPSTSIRIRAYFKPLDKPLTVETQALPIPPERKGFTLVEWGGILDD
jgi:hypothetical protein